MLKHPVRLLTERFRDTYSPSLFTQFKRRERGTARMGIWASYATLLSVVIWPVNLDFVEKNSFCEQTMISSNPYFYTQGLDTDIIFNFWIKMWILTLYLYQGKLVLYTYMMLYTYEAVFIKLFL